MPGCAAKPVPYGPIGPETPYGYQDRQNIDGGFTVLVAMSGFAVPSELRAFFDRRAGELCPGGIERTNVFKMTRDERTSLIYHAHGTSMASRVATGSHLEGYVYCKPAPDDPPAETAPEG